MYPNIIFVSAVIFFFKLYSIISVENKYNCCHEIHFVNFNLALDCSRLRSNWIFL